MDMPRGIDAEAAVNTVAAQVSVTTQLNEKRHIVIQTFLERDANVATYHALLDKIGAASDRQEAKYRLDGLRANLEVHEKTLEQLKGDYERISAAAEAAWQQRGKKGSATLNASEAAQKGNAEQNIKRYQQEIVKLKAEIAQCEAIVAGP